MAFRKNNRNDAVPQGSQEDAHGEPWKLMVLTDGVRFNLMAHLDMAGIAASKVRTDMEDLKRDFILESGNVHVIVIEHGSGRFSSSDARLGLRDIIDMCEGSSRRLDIFYAKENLKGELWSKKKAKGETWVPYKGLAGVIGHIRGLALSYDATPDRYDDDDTRYRYSGGKLYPKITDIKEATPVHGHSDVSNTNWYETQERNNSYDTESGGSYMGAHDDDSEWLHGFKVKT